MSKYTLTGYALTGAGARRKGHDFERALVRKFREAMPGVDVKRGYQSRSGKEQADVDCPVYWVEAKCGKQPSPRAALRQAIKDAPEGRVPVAVIKDDRKAPFVCLLLDDWLDLVKENWELGER